MTQTAHHSGASSGFKGPGCWAISAIAGIAAGLVLSRLAPGSYDGATPLVAPWLVAPFAVLLLAIAVMPFINAPFWHDHFPDVSFFLGAMVGAYYLAAFTLPGYKDGLPFGAYATAHALVEYYAFIALVGGLYIASGGVVVDVRGGMSPARNTLLLAAGAVLANVFGTTGASVLLVRPFIRENRGRIRPMHVVYFIFIVSNCGGCLTPIGDPPLFLGYIKGVKFQWTLVELWPAWLLVVGALLAMFYVYDRRVGPAPPAARAAATPPAETFGVSVRGAGGIIALCLMVGAVFIDPLLPRLTGLRPHYPVGPLVQIVVAIAAYFTTPRRYHQANGFSLFPIKEVGLLFVGIFLTMMPALAYLSKNAPGWGISSPTAYYFLTGSLSATLDNAPTYLSFLQMAFGDTPINSQTIHEFLLRPQAGQVLEGISLGAVFFGAMTYIGNGPNFMVKAVAESSGVQMPSFFGYLARAMLILLPVLVLAWALFVR